MPELGRHACSALRRGARRSRRRTTRCVDADPDALLPAARTLDARRARRSTSSTRTKSSLRLVRIAALLGEMQGPRVVDLLIDILGCDEPEARHAGGRGARGARVRPLQGGRAGRRARARAAARRAARRSPSCRTCSRRCPSPARSSSSGASSDTGTPTPWPSAIEALVEIGDPAALPLLEPLDGGRAHGPARRRGRHRGRRDNRRARRGGADAAVEGGLRERRALRPASTIHAAVRHRSRARAASAPPRRRSSRRSSCRATCRSSASSRSRCSPRATTRRSCTCTAARAIPIAASRMKLPGAHIVGVDASPGGARARAREGRRRCPDMVSEYRLLEELPTPLPALGVLARPHAASARRTPTSAALVLGEFARAARARTGRRSSRCRCGAASRSSRICCASTRSSTTTTTSVARRRAARSMVRPTVEMLGAELEEAGFDFVDVQPPADDARLPERPRLLRGPGRPRCSSCPRLSST